MSTDVTPSAEVIATTTDGQISKAIGNYRALLEKHAPEFTSEAFQKGLGHPNLAIEMFALLRKYIEMFSKLITRVVSGIERTLSPKEVLKNTGRKQYVENDVVETIPRGMGDTKTIVLFKLDLSERDGVISDDNLEKEFRLRKLKPDPYTLAKVNQDDPTFADKYPNATHWRDENGKWCYVVFRQWIDDERIVSVSRNDNWWDDAWWFAGVPE